MYICPLGNLRLLQQKYRPGRLFELDALRGVAALMVVFMHYTMDRPQSNAFWQLGKLSVDLFFVISGFVIFMTLDSCKSVKDFTIKRFARLYPAYWACMTLTTLILIPFGFEHFDKQTLYKFLANLTMNGIYFLQPNMDGVYWTLQTELQFYLFVIIIFAAKKTEKIEKIIAAYLVLSIAFGTITIIYALPEKIHTTLFYYINIIFALPLFFVGILFYRLMYKGKSRNRYLLIAGCFLARAALGHLDYRIIQAGNLYYFSVLAGIYALFFLFINGHLHFIVNRVSVFFGNISYPLYLIHMNAGLLVVLPNINLRVSYWYAMLITVAIMVIVAYLVHILVEKPAQRYIKRKWLSGKSDIPQQELVPETLSVH